MPSGVNIDLDLRAIAANRHRDRARSDSHFPILEPKADLAGGARCDLPVAGVQLPLVERGDRGDVVVGLKDRMARISGISPFRSKLNRAYTAPGYLGKSEGRQVLEPFLTPWTNE